MGERGPLPKPTALKVMEGNRGKRPLNGAEPKPDPIAPDPPPVVVDDSLALEEWNRLCGELEKLGLLTRLDRGHLAAYVKAYANWVRAEKVLIEQGATYKVEVPYSEGGTEGHFMWKPRPEVIIARNERLAMRAFGRELGLSPSARGAMQIRLEPKDEELDLD